MPREIWPVTAAILKFKMAAFSLKALNRLISVSTAAFVKSIKSQSSNAYPFQDIFYCILTLKVFKMATIFKDGRH